MTTLKFFNEFINSRVSMNLSPATINWYRQRLESFVAACPEPPYTPQQIEAFLAGVKGSPRTRFDTFGALRTFLRFIKKRHPKIRNPLGKISAPRKPKKLPATLEVYELMRLLSVSANAGLQDKTILILLIDNGLRASEVATLRQKDVSMDTVRVNGKSGEREVPISEETHRLLMELITQNDGSEFVFTGHKGTITRKYIYSMVAKYMKLAGISKPKLGPHRLRHAFAKGFLDNGGDVRTLQEIMGHANISTTQIYTQVSRHILVAKHHEFTPLKAAQAAAQMPLILQEAVEIVMKKGGEKPNK